MINFMSCISHSVCEGVEHCITAPVGAERNPLRVDDEFMISRSITEQRGFPKRDTILDRLSERAKVLEVLLHLNDLKFQTCVCVFLF